MSTHALLASVPSSLNSKRRKSGAAKTTAWVARGRAAGPVVRDMRFPIAKVVAELDARQRRDIIER